jgi:hypothetical protein
MNTFNRCHPALARIITTLRNSIDNSAAADVASLIGIATGKNAGVTLLATSASRSTNVRRQK